MTEDTWNTGILSLQAVYGKLEVGQLKIYAQILKDIPDEIFKAGITRLIHEYQYDSFPKPAVIIKYCGIDAKSKAINALRVLKEAIFKVGPYQSIDFDDSTLHAVIERFGGWVSVCQLSEDDWRYKEKMFLESYESMDVSGVKGRQYLMGIFEITNRKNGYDVKPPMLITNKYEIPKFISSQKKYLLTDRTNSIKEICDSFTIPEDDDEENDMVKI